MHIERELEKNRDFVEAFWEVVDAAHGETALTDERIDSILTGGTVEAALTILKQRTTLKPFIDELSALHEQRLEEAIKADPNTPGTRLFRPGDGGIFRDLHIIRILQMLAFYGKHKEIYTFTAGLKTLLETTRRTSEMLLSSARLIKKPFVFTEGNRKQCFILQPSFQYSLGERVTLWICNKYLSESAADIILTGPSMGVRVTGSFERQGQLNKNKRDIVDPVVITNIVYRAIGAFNYLSVGDADDISPKPAQAKPTIKSAPRILEIGRSLDSVMGKRGVESVVSRWQKSRTRAGQVDLVVYRKKSARKKKP